MNDGWQMRNLGELCTLISGRHLRPKQHNTESRGIGYLTGPADFGPLNPVISRWTEHPQALAKRGDILITVKGAGVGKINLLAADTVAISRQLMAVRVTEGDPRFLFAFLGWQFEHFQSLGSGATVPGISRDNVLDLQVPMPPLAEQRRIVGILDEAFDGITTAKANAERNLQNARALFESQLQAAFNRRGERRDRDAALSSVLSTQPRNGWSPPAEFQTGSGTPVLTLSAVTGFKYDGSRTKLSSAPTREEAHYWLENGELLITRSNTRELVGHVAIYDGIPAKAICCDLIMKMKVDPKKAITRFVYFFLRSPEARAYFTTRAHGASSTMKKIGKQVVQNILIPLPALEEQGLIVSTLDSLQEETQRLESLYQRKLAALDALKKSLLHRAFSGQL